VRPLYGFAWRWWSPWRPLWAAIGGRAPLRRRPGPVAGNSKVGVPDLWWQLLLPTTSWGENPARLRVLDDDGGASAPSPSWRRRHFLSRRRRLLGQVSERKFLRVVISTWLESAGVISFWKATLLHPPRPLSQAPPLLWSSRWMVLPELFAVVVAWLSPATDVVLGSTSGSYCQACDVPSRMLYHGGFT
jgi:hypothetical protein